MTRVLVTGGAGFIGSNFIRLLLSGPREYQVINLDKLTYAGNLANLADLEQNPNYQFVQGDIADAKIVETVAAEVDVIVNFAAETHVDRSIGNPNDFLSTDIFGVFVLLEAVRKYNIKRFIQISTDEVYGEAGDEVSTEQSPLMPKSPYAASKAGGDRLAFSYFTTYNTPVVITRCTNNYGPYQYPEKMIPLFVTNALEDKPLPVYGDGLNTRDWVYVNDHAAAIERLIHEPHIVGEVFNIGSNREVSVLEMASTILEVLDKPKSLIEYVQDRPGHVKRHAVDVSKLEMALDWQPQYNFDIAIRETVLWYKEHPEWWQPIKSGEFREYYQRQYQAR